MDNQLMKRPNILSAQVQLEQTGLALEYFPAFEQSLHDFHTHDFIEMLYVIDGNFRHITADRTYDESAGGLTILNYKQFHSLKTAYGPVKLINVYWNPAMYPVPDLPEELATQLWSLIPQHQILGHRINLIRHLSVLNTEKMTQLLLMLVEELQSEHPGYTAAVQALFRLFLIELCRAALTPAPPTIVYDEDAQHHNPRMEQVRIYLEINYTEPIRLEQLCRLSRLKSANLCRQFKVYTGMSTGDYLKQQRLAAALQKLRMSSDKILTICNDCGFPDISRFNRLFRNTFNCTPSEYRHRFLSTVKADSSESAIVN